MCARVSREILTSHDKTPIAWEPVDVTPILKDGKTAIPDAAIENIQKNKIALKGPLAVRGLSAIDD